MDSLARMTGVVTNDRKSNPYPAETWVRKQPSRRGVLTSAELYIQFRRDRCWSQEERAEAFCPLF